MALSDMITPIALAPAVLIAVDESIFCALISPSLVITSPVTLAEVLKTF